MSDHTTAREFLPGDRVRVAQLGRNGQLLDEHYCGVVLPLVGEENDNFRRVLLDGHDEPHVFSVNRLQLDGPEAPQLIPAFDFAAGIAGLVKARLRVEVRRSDVGVDELAEVTGIPAGNLTSWLDGLGAPDLDGFVRVVLALGLDVADLFAAGRPPMRTSVAKLVLFFRDAYRYVALSDVIDLFERTALWPSATGWAYVIVEAERIEAERRTANERSSVEKYCRTCECAESVHELVGDGHEFIRVDVAELVSYVASLDDRGGAA